MVHCLPTRQSGRRGRTLLFYRASPPFRCTELSQRISPRGRTDYLSRKPRRRYCMSTSMKNPTSWTTPLACTSSPKGSWQRRPGLDLHNVDHGTPGIATAGYCLPSAVFPFPALWHARPTGESGLAPRWLISSRTAFSSRQQLRKPTSQPTTLHQRHFSSNLVELDCGMLLKQKTRPACTPCVAGPFSVTRSSRSGAHDSCSTRTPSKMRTWATSPDGPEEFSH